VSVAIEAHGIGKQYGSLVAVHDLSFSADAGEILGVLGPNGRSSFPLLPERLH
jgi:ABC-type Na+ transport system ATPase subunit NatA